MKINTYINSRKYKEDLKKSTNELIREMTILNVLNVWLVLGIIFIFTGVILIYRLLKEKYLIIAILIYILFKILTS